MNTITISSRELFPRRIESKSMDILWAAWVTDFAENHTVPSGIDIVGIYDAIDKNGKADFPFTVDLKIVLAYRVMNSVDFNQIYPISFDFRDQWGANIIFQMNDQLKIIEGTIPVQLYESYKFNKVTIREPGLYWLSILINGRVETTIPLRVIADRLSVIDLKRGIDIEMWPEDYEDFLKRGI